MNLNKFNKLVKMDISFNKIGHGNDGYHKQIGESLNVLLIDFDYIDTFKYLNNSRIVSQNVKNKYYKALFLIVNSKLDYVDCKLQLKLLKNNILLNLFYSYQADGFLSYCTNFIGLNF